MNRIETNCLYNSPGTIVAGMKSREQRSDFY